jgi:adenylate cyclase
MRPSPAVGPDVVDLGRLLLEDICSDLLRFLHSHKNPSAFEAVHIDREFALGPPGAFADLRVEPSGEPPYFLEVKYGYDAATLFNHLRRKYGEPGARTADANRVVLVVDTEQLPDWKSVENALRAALPSHLTLELWDTPRLQELVSECFGETIESFAPSEIVSVRELIDQAKERLAFRTTAPAGYGEQVLRQNLMWHFATWRLRELCEAHDGNALAILPPGEYEHVVVLMADLSGFSGYVRDTSDHAVVRHALTNFYAKARYQVTNAGGMMDQFVGDEVVAVFGIPDRRPGYVEAALRTAQRLLDIGASVSLDWQRKIDHIQAGGGVHIAMAMGRVHVAPMRAFDHARVALLGDPMNIAGRLLPVARSGEIVISNVLRYALQSSACEFDQLEPVEAHNVGTILPWRLCDRSS